MGTGWSEAPASELQLNEGPSASITRSNSRARTEEKQNDFKSKTRDKTGNSKLSDNKLPHNYECIVRNADSPIDSSSMEKLYDQLYAGVYLNQRRKKYWVDKKSNSNCFMLFARNLSITWVENNQYWSWTNLKQTSVTFSDVAELLNVCWLEVHGKFEISKLSPGVLYKVAFMIMMKDEAYGWDVPVNVRLILPDGSKQEHKENMMGKPRGELVEITVGEFETSSKNVGDIEVSMFEYEGGIWKRGLIIVAIIIQPKN